MVHIHIQHDTSVMLYERNSLGDNKFYHRGVVSNHSGISEGDSWVSFTHPGNTLTVAEVLSANKSRATGGIHFEAIMEFRFDNQPKEFKERPTAEKLDFYIADIRFNLFGRDKAKLISNE